MGKATGQSKTAKRQEKTQESGCQGGGRTLNFSLCIFSGATGEVRSMKAGGSKTRFPNSCYREADEEKGKCLQSTEGKRYNVSVYDKYRYVHVAINIYR